MNNLDTLQVRAKALQLNGLLTHWTQVATEGWVNSLIDWEGTNGPAAAWSAACVRLVSAASNLSATSTGTGPSAAIAPPSKP